MYESSDGGSGDPRKTFWGFHVANQAFTTDNPFLAETVRLAISSNSRVQVTAGADGKVSQVRIAFGQPTAADGFC